MNGHRQALTANTAEIDDSSKKETDAGSVYSYSNVEILTVLDRREYYVKSIFSHEPSRQSLYVRGLCMTTDDCVSELTRQAIPSADRSATAHRCPLMPMRVWGGCGSGGLLYNLLDGDQQSSRVFRVQVGDATVASGFARMKRISTSTLRQRQSFSMLGEGDDGVNVPK